MNWLDALLAATAVLWGLVRSRRGAARVLVELLSAALGLWAAVRFTDAAAGWARVRGWSYAVAWPSAFVLLWAVPVLLGQALSGTMASSPPRRRAAAWDKAMAGLMGAAEILVATVGLVFLAEGAGRASQPPFADSFVVGSLRRALPALAEWLAEVLAL